MESGKYSDTRNNKISDANFANAFKDGSEVRAPKLIINININPTETRQLTVYEGDKAEDLAETFSQQYGELVIKGLDMNRRSNYHSKFKRL